MDGIHKRKNVLLRCIRLLCGLICVVGLAATLYVTPVHAASTDEKIGLLVGEDAEGNPVSIATGVALQGNGIYLAVSGSAVISDAAVCYYYLSQDNMKYVAEYNGYDSYVGVVMWTLDAQANSDYFAPCAEGYQYEEISAYYLDSEGYVQCSDGTLADITVDGDYVFFETSGLSVSDRLDIAVLFDGDGYCLGIVGETGIIWAIATSQDSFYPAATTETVTEEQTTEERTTEEKTTEEAAEKETTEEQQEDKDTTKDGAESDKKIEIIVVIGIVAAVAMVAAGIIAYKKINTGTPPENSYSEEMQYPPEQSFYSEPEPVQPQNMMSAGMPIPTPLHTAGVLVQVCGVGGCMNGQIYEVNSGELLFGRDMSATVRFPADTQGVSRIHCKLFWQNGVLMLMDMGSSYGTYLKGNGKLTPRQAVAVKAGDTFYLGEKKNSFIIK